MRPAHLPALSALLILAACSGDKTPTKPEPEPARSPGIRFPAGAGVSDTIGTVPVQALRVEVIGPDGKPAAGTTIRVDAILVPVSQWESYAEVQATRVGGNAYFNTVSDSTNAQGIAHFQVKLGPKAGAARLVITAPVLGMQDTARYTILPGAATSFRMVPADTAVQVGRSVTLRAGAFDRNGNPRGDAITYTTQGAGGTVSNGVVSGTSFGRLSVVAEAGGRSDTSYVSVVPQGTVAAYSRPENTGQAGTIYVLNLDGSDFREVRRSLLGAGFFMEMPVAWLSSTKLIYHDTHTPHARQLYVHDLASGETRRFFPSPDRMELEHLPRTSHDRSWVYFSAGTSTSNSWLYRARPDGTGRERISPASAPPLHWGATPSPDGTQVAYVWQGDDWIGQLEVIDLATRQVRKLDIKGTTPRWSPDGSQIAYIAQSGTYNSPYGELSVVRPDGTGARILTRGTTRFQGDIDWSPDGRYIVGAVVGGKLAVVEAATGSEIILNFPNVGRPLSSPVWKP